MFMAVPGKVNPARSPAFRGPIRPGAGQGGQVSWRYLHLVVEAFPAVLSVTGALVGLAGWAADRPLLERYGLACFLVAGIFAPVAYFTGLAAADVVAQRTFVTPSLVQAHRAWATWATLGLMTSGVFGAFALFQPDDRRLRRFVLVVGLLAATLTAVASIRGGDIEHGSRGGAAPAQGAGRAA